MKIVIGIIFGIVVVAFFPDVGLEARDVIEDVVEKVESKI